MSEEPATYGIDRHTGRAATRVTWCPASAPPPHNRVVLIAAPGSDVYEVCCGYFDDDDSVWRDTEGMECEPTHWATLPPAPKGPR